MASYGQSGSSLEGEGAYQRFGHDAIIGRDGERYFGDMLRRAGMTGSYTVWASLRIPSKPGQKRYSGDVDFAVSNGNTVVLVDIKRWASGYHYWTIPFLRMPFKNLSPIIKNGEWRLSSNMELAVSRFSEALPGVAVSAIVVFVPTDVRRGAMPASVGLLRWPGGIRSYLAGDGIQKIRSLLGISTPSNDRIRAVLGSLVHSSR